MAPWRQPTTLLMDKCRLDVIASDVAELDESTGGWTAALQMVSLSLRDHPDPAPLIEHLSGRIRRLSPQPRVLDFLRHGTDLHGVGDGPFPRHPVGPPAELDSADPLTTGRIPCVSVRTRLAPWEFSARSCRARQR